MFGVKLHKYLTPILVFNVNGTPNKLGELTHYAKILVQMEGYVRQVNAAISSLEKCPLVLEHNWLKKYNPDINWQEELIMFTENYPLEDKEKVFVINRLFIEKDGGTLYTLNLDTYLQAQETKANTITSEEFAKALKEAKRATLLDQYKEYIDVFSKEGFDLLLEK